MAETKIYHSGKAINYVEDPIGAAKLALNAAQGCSSKSKAWSWAYDAVHIIGAHHSEDLSESVQAALNDSSTNFPNVAAALLLLPDTEED